MFFDCDICGDRLPAKTICLTYDDGPGATAGDGPGPQTREIGRYLFEQQIAAAFFVVGSHAVEHLELVKQLSSWGHVVGNHTYTHSGMVGLAQEGGDVVQEVLRTEEVLRSCAEAPVRFFRAPYGSWREVHRTPAGDAMRSPVAERLNEAPELAHYVGHIHWDICTCDYDFWNAGAPAEACAEFCLGEILRLQRGIVLLHDSSEDSCQRGRNRTREVTERIVPFLKSHGFRFVRIDEIPQVRSAMRTRSLVTLELGDGRSLCSLPGDAVGFRIRPHVPAEPGSAPGGPAERWGLIPLSDDTFALRAANGCYLSSDGGSLAEVRADGTEIGQPQTFRFEIAPDGKAFLQTLAGECLAPSLVANSRWLSSFAVGNTG